METVEERTQHSEGQIVMPFYLVCDVSGSMRPVMAELNQGLARLRKAIIDEAIVYDVARLSLITFSDHASTEVPLGLVDAPMPVLGAINGTNYGRAFEEVRRAILADRDAFKAQGYKFFRPAVFFLTDGAPQDGDWKSTFDRTLTLNPEGGEGFDAYPFFIPFGFGSAREDVIRTLAYPAGKAQWYFSHSNQIEDALSGILDVIMRTVMTSTASARTAAPGGAPQPAFTMAPQLPAGLTTGPSEHDGCI